MPNGRRRRRWQAPHWRFSFRREPSRPAANGNRDYGLSQSCCADLDQRIAELEATVAAQRQPQRLSGARRPRQQRRDGLGRRRRAERVRRHQRQPALALQLRRQGGDRRHVGGGLRHRHRPPARQLQAGQPAYRTATASCRRQFDLRSSVWFLRNKRYGTMFLGTTFAATDRIANSNVTQTGSFDQYAAPENAGLGMFLRSARDGRLTRSLLNWRRIIGAGGDQPGESQRGFSLTEVCVSDMERLHLRRRLGHHRLLGRGPALSQGGCRLRYRRRHRLPEARRPARARAASARWRPWRSSARRPACSQVRGSVSAKHLDTGLFVNFGASSTGDGIVDETTRYADTGVERPRDLLLRAGGHRARLGCRSARRRSMPTTTTTTAAPRRRCSSAMATRSTRRASAIGPCGGRASTSGVAALRRASIAPR